MIIEEFFKRYKDTKTTRWYFFMKCDKCLKEFNRERATYNKMKNNILYDKDYCKYCWNGVINSQPSYRENMKKSLRKLWDSEKGMELRKQMSDLSKGKKTGENNPMKRKEVAEKVSKKRIQMFLDNPQLKIDIANKSANAWKEGKFDNVKTGLCEWYTYNHSNGNQYKVQGTWELAFIEWLDMNKLEFLCHKNRIPYVFNEIKRNYYPDFYVFLWNSYVDVKSTHFYDKEKFDAISKHNPNLNLKLLFKNDLLNLGINLKIYEKTKNQQNIY